ncbi:hypothetical protein GQ457_13G001600 [Hibiscus cannabinus]
MELQFPSLLTLFASFLFLSVAVKILKKVKASESNIQQLPPGPWRLPLIGNLHQLVGSLPHCILRDLADQHGPLMHLQLGETSNIVVSSPEIAKEVLITHGTVFAERPYVIAINTITYGYRDIAMAPYGNYWRQVRKICTVELLTAKRVKSFESIRQEEVSNLVQYVSSNEGSLINLSKKIFGSTYGITSRAAFGSKYNDTDSYSSIVEEIVKLASGFSIADMYPSSRVLRLMSGMSKKLETLFEKSDKILQGIIDEQRGRLEGGRTGDEGEDVREDLITVLLKIQHLGELELPLSDNDIKAIIWDVFSGGSETSSTIVDWAMSEMMKNPRVLKKAQNEFQERVGRTAKLTDTGYLQRRRTCLLWGVERLSTIAEWTIPELLKNPRLMEKAKAEVRNVFNGKGSADEEELSRIEVPKISYKGNIEVAQFSAINTKGMP